MDNILGLPVWLGTTILGFGTVFVGLILLIFIIKLMSMLCRRFQKTVVAMVSAPSQAAEPIENRQQFVAAVSAALAMVMGSEISGLRITSIKKVK